MHLPQPQRMGLGRVTTNRAVVAICCVAICLTAASISNPAQSTKTFIAGWVRFTNTGNPAKQATLELRRRGSRRPIKITKTDSNGNYRFDDVMPGLYRLKLRYKPGVCAETLDVDTRQNSEPEANIITEGC